MFEEPCPFICKVEYVISCFRPTVVKIHKISAQRSEVYKAVIIAHDIVHVTDSIKNYFSFEPYWCIQSLDWTHIYFPLFCQLAQQRMGRSSLMQLGHSPIASQALQTSLNFFYLFYWQLSKVDKSTTVICHFCAWREW